MKNISVQSASAVLMVEPLTFGFDEQTAQTNSFQTELLLSKEIVLAQAMSEFTAIVDGLRSHDILVQVYRTSDPRNKPNAVFPNNWLSMWPDGTIYLYPMATKSRRIERSKEAIDELAHQFSVNKVIDISETEQHSQYLESTGVIIFDHLHKVMYGCISERCDEQLFTDHAAAIGYKPVTFHAYDMLGAPIYHTNVMMGVQTNSVVICAESITDDNERAHVLASLTQTGRQVVEITYAQMTTFCGNILELHNTKGERFLAMSQSAYDNFTDNERRLLSEDKILLPYAIPTIETIGGGSVRCMLAEIFLPRL